MRAFQGEVGEATIKLGSATAAALARFRWANELSETEGVTRILISWIVATRQLTGLASCGTPNTV